jgi:hypothetical protein
VSCFQKAQPPEFHERDVAAGELDFELGAVMGRPEQDCLFFEWHAGLARLKDTGCDVLNLIGSVPDRHEHRLLGRAAIGDEILREPLRRKRDHRV